MREFASAFYSGTAWKETRKAYAKSVGGLCEVCLAKGIYKAGEIVHHKLHLNEHNISDPAVALSWDNLQLVCRDCHAEIHGDKKASRRFTVDELGRVLPR